MKIKIIGVGIFSLALTLGVWSYSQANNDEITICAKKSGLVYVIGNGFKRADCMRNDSLLTWNIRGLTGEKGDKGDSGDIGPMGSQGLIGEIGPRGLQGEQGIQGAKGEDGGVGVMGPIGLTGEKGDKGDSGTSETQIIMGAPAHIQMNGQGNALATATCPTNKFVLGGGANYFLSNTSNTAYINVALTQSFPSSISTWQTNVVFSNNPSGDITLIAYAICTK